MYKALLLTLLIALLGKSLSWPDISVLYTVLLVDQTVGDRMSQSLKCYVTDTLLRFL